MARNSDEENWECSNSEEEEEEEETLSLCDLPVILITGENQSRKEAQTFKAEEEEFEFGSWGGSLVTESEMCAADDVFFQGQILPLRLSVSSDNGLAGIPKDSRNTSRCVSRSESMDHSSLGGFTSVSSRSSSIRSHHSSSSTNSITTTTTTTTAYKSRVQNQFHTHPSPKPQIRVSGARPANRNQKSTIWGLFRLGLVRTPEIELQDLKLRNNKGSESRSSSNSSSSSFSEKNSRYEVKLEKKKKQRLLEKKSGFMSGCKCSVNAVETIHSRIVIIKSSSNKKVSEREVREEKQKHGKQALSGRRTFDWVKELSIAGAPEEA